MTFNNGMTPGLDWTPGGRSIIFSASRAGRPGFWSLWRVPSSGGEPEPLDVGEQGARPSLAKQGGRLAYEKRDSRFNIWRAGGPAARGEDTFPKRFIASTQFENFPHYSPDGQKIVFGSYRSGYQEIWMCDSDGSNPRQLTFLEDAVSTAGRWSPNSQQIAFLSGKEGNYDIYLVSATGGPPRRFTDETSDERTPSWSNDGRWIYFNSNRTGKYELYKMPVEGGDAIQITENGGTRALESPDGRFVLFTKNDYGGGQHGIWRIPIEGGEEVQVLDHGELMLWDVLERGICYLNRDSVPTTLEFFNFATSEVSQISVLEKQPTALGFSVSPDGQWILYQVAETESDIMLVENFR